MASFPDRDVIEFEYETECCRIPTIFNKSKTLWIFRLIPVRILFWKAQVHHSLQSAISHTKVNKYTLNSYLHVHTD